MRAVVQRVLNAGVTVDGECVGRIGRGYLVLLGVGHGDTRDEADKLWGKLRGLRINEDENGKTNLALATARCSWCRSSRCLPTAATVAVRRLRMPAHPMLPTSSTSTS